MGRGDGEGGGCATVMGRSRPERLRRLGGGTASLPSGPGKLELAVVLVLIAWSAVPGLWFGRDRPGLPAIDPLVAALGAAQAVPLLWRRRAPDVVLIASGLAVGLGLMAQPRILPGSIALLVAAYSVPVYARRRVWAWSGWLAWVVGTIALLLFSGYAAGPPQVTAPDALFPLYLAGPWAWVGSAASTSTSR